MSAATKTVAQGPASPVRIHAVQEAALDQASTAFGLSAAITIVFNTLLAWAKDAYDPLNSFMASLAGHHWITHGLADIILFVLLGWLFMSRGVRIGGMALVRTVAAAVVGGGGGLAAWFFLT
jgi:hypothetical protein